MKDRNENKIEVWVADLVLVYIRGDMETIQVEMPDAHSASKLLDLLATSYDVTTKHSSKRISTGQERLTHDLHQAVASPD